MHLRREHLLPLAVAAVAVALGVGEVHAKPQGPMAFCGAYPDAPGCQGTIVTCSQCHDGPPTFNAFGMRVAEALWESSGYDGSGYAAALPAALAAVESEDSDGDGLTNLEEILLGTAPGNPQSHWAEPVLVGELDNPHFLVGEWDPAFAYRRVSINYCGVSPTYEDLQALKQAVDPRQAVHELLDACLESDYWKNEALHRLADKRIRPLKAVGKDGDIILADYDWDYRLFSYVLSGDRDARDLLRATYHVDEDGEVVTGTVGRAPGSLLGMPIRVGSGQPLEAQRRAGMITTQWFFVVNTMFSQLPRTTAAQAYRAYLGQDIAKGEGIMPVEGEPRDVDNKGVQNPTCAACHSTLDPLAYAFSSYNGIEISLFGNPTGRYEEDRTPWGGDGFLFGQPVLDVVDWAHTASDSDLFKRNLASMFFEHALGHGPQPGDNTQFAALWQSLPEDGYSANRLLHRLVDTDAFGVP